MQKNDFCCTNLGIKLVKVGRGWAEMTLRIEKNMVNGHQICHGGMIFTLADATFAYSSNTYNKITLATGGNIEFLKSAYLNDILTAYGRERRRGRLTGVYDVEIFNQKNQLVALFRGKAFIANKKIIENQ